MDEKELKIRSRNISLGKHYGLTGKDLPKMTDEERQRKLTDSAMESGISGIENKNRLDTSSKDIIIRSFSLSYESNVLLKDTDLKLAHGRKYGLIGHNGSGKTTLLRHIAYHLPIPNHIRILYVEQEVEGDDTTALDAVLKADTERLQLLEEQSHLELVSEENTDEGLEASDRLVEVINRLKEIDAFSAEARAISILAGLAFNEEMRKRPTKYFSGGWRMRIALARALFLSPDLLLLDEPTNHLDLNASIWLSYYLGKWKNTLLVVSHNRDFLDEIVTNIIHLNSQTLTYYKGNYEAFEKASKQNRKKQEKWFKKHRESLKRLRKRQYDPVAREKLEKLKKKDIRPPVSNYSVRFIFLDPGTLGIPIIQIKDVSFGYNPGELLFRNLELNIDLENKIGILGPNGVGKSTLINLIYGNLEPIQGEIIRNRHLRIAKFSQHFVDQLTMTQTPVEYIQKHHPDMKEQDIRNSLGRFGLKGRTHFQPVSLLSGGQKSRVVFANITLTKPHLLFLDEPTNHLDIESVDALTKALCDYQGGVILISHDQRLVSRVCRELWVVKGDQTVVEYDGDFDDYRQEIIAE